MLAVTSMPVVALSQGVVRSAPRGGSTARVFGTSKPIDVVSRCRHRGVTVTVRAKTNSSSCENTKSSSNDSTHTRRGLFRLTTGTALASAVFGGLSMESLVAPLPAVAMFNKDLDTPIEDPIQAIAVVYAVRACIQDVLDQMELFSETCPAPVFPCDLSQLSTKASTRISGPLKRALPALTEAYGADPYAVQDIIQSVSTTEAMLMANNARVKVDFKSPAEYFNLVDSSIVSFLEEVPPEKLAEGKELYESCDLTVDPREEASLECRLGRAVAQNARPTGGVS
tara:strand:+ start:4928 stop:5776 length:849 start_codon:yes stop_codon:yes gene_type:complete